MNAIITGASKGIGKAIAEKLVKENMNVCICARNKSDLEKVKEELILINADVEIYILVADLSKPEDCKLFASFALDKMKTIDLLINNAGQFIPGEIATEEAGMLASMIETNLYSAYHLTRAILPQMKFNDLGAGTRGHIFNICSVAGIQPYQNGGSYSISKFALVGFSKNLREELKPYHIKVTTVNPGATYSDSWNGSGIEASRIMEANDIAESIWSAFRLSPQAVVEEIILRPLLGDL